MAFHSEDAGPDRLKYGVLEGRHQILHILDRVRVCADLVADRLPAQAHRAHDALGRQLERQILEDRCERHRRRRVAGVICRRGRPGGESAAKRGADGFERPLFARRFIAGIHERGHGRSLGWQSLSCATHETAKRAY